MSNTSILVSVIVTTCNSRDDVQHILKSLQNQSYGNMELIVIDDGSTDGTKEVMEQIAADDTRISYTWQENSGVSVARNVGMKNAHGDIIMFADADDEFPLDGVAQVVKFMRESPVDICFGGVELRSDGGSAVLHSLNTDERIIKGHDGIDDVISCCLEGQGFSTGKRTMQLSGSVWAKGFSHSFLKEHDLWFNPHLPRAQDVEFVLRCLGAAAAVGNLTRCIYIYKVLEGSHSHKYNADLPKQFANMIAAASETIQHRDSKRLVNDLNIMALNLAIESARRASLDGADFAEVLQSILNMVIYRDAVHGAKIRSTLRIKENIKLLILKMQIRNMYKILY